MYESNSLTIWPQLPFVSSFLVTGYRIVTPLLLMVCVLCLCMCCVFTFWALRLDPDTLVDLIQYIRIRTLTFHDEYLHLVHMASVSVYLPCAHMKSVKTGQKSTWKENWNRSHVHQMKTLNMERECPDPDILKLDPQECLDPDATPKTWRLIREENNKSKWTNILAPLCLLPCC